MMWPGSGRTDAAGDEEAVREMQPVEITAGRLHLRIPGPAEVDAIYRSCQDPDIQYWTALPVPYRLADAEEFVEATIPAGWESGRAVAFAVLDSTSAELLAMVALSRLDGGNRTGQIGYWCAPWARRTGVVTQASAVLCRWAFGALSLGLIEWYAEVGNVPSRRVAERVGFTVEGTLRQRLIHRGERVDAWVGSVLPAEVTTQVTRTVR
jgi:RimJ/RimL family protein N-acetyltransferase